MNEIWSDDYQWLGAIKVKNREELFNRKVMEGFVQMALVLSDKSTWVWSPKEEKWKPMTMTVCK